MFEFKEFNQLWEFWSSIKSENKIPRRKDFRPEKVIKLLGEMSIYEWQDPDVLNIRLVGMHLVNRVGVDTTGYNYMEWAAPEVGEFFVKEWRKIFNYPCGLSGVFQDRSKTGRILENGFLSLPLSIEGAVNNQMLLVEKDLDIEELAYDSRSPEVITLGIKDIKLIDLGFGIPDIDIEYYENSMLYTG